MARYGVIVDGRKGAYGVVIPDLPGCVAMGKTTDEALRNAASCAVEWAELAHTKGMPIRKPRSLDDLRTDPEVAAELADGGTLALVSVILDSARAVKANVSLDSALLDELDAAAALKKLTRSAFIASAVREKILAEG